MVSWVQYHGSPELIQSSSSTDDGIASSDAAAIIKPFDAMLTAFPNLDPTLVSLPQTPEINESPKIDSPINFQSPVPKVAVTVSSNPCLSSYQMINLIFFP